MEHQTGDKYLHLKIEAASFGTAWWLFVAPAATRWMWSRLFSSELPTSLDSLLNWNWLVLMMIAVVAAGALSSDFRDRKYLQMAARGFLLGILAVSLMAALVFL